MIYNPQLYRIPDEPMKPFIDPNEIWDTLNNVRPCKEQVREIINKALNKHRLSMMETAVLVNTTDPELIEEIKQGARTLKEKVYGHRIVLFAPLYIGNLCTNNCAYCGYKASNKEVERVTLNEEEIVRQVKSAITTGD